MRLMCGIERWGGLSALMILFGRRPGPLAQAGMATGLWPSRLGAWEIPLPPLSEQRRLVAEIESYQNEIERLKTEIANQERNIQKSIARVWGEDSDSANGAPPSQPRATPQVEGRKQKEG